MPHRHRRIGRLQRANAERIKEKSIRSPRRASSERVGRFLSVDPIIGNPLSSQSLNPYSYIGNNPLSGVDPTGYYAESCTVSSGNSCSTSYHDSRSADPFSKTDVTFSMDSKGNVNATTSDGRGGTVIDNAGKSNGHDQMTEKGATSTPSDGSASSIGTPHLDISKGVMVAQNKIDPSVCAEAGAELCAAHSGGEGKAPINQLQNKIAAGEEAADEVATTVAKEAVNPINYIAPEARLLKGTVEGVNDVRRATRAKNILELPALDATGKVHGLLPEAKDLGKYSVDELTRLRDELRQSIQKRIEVTTQKGSDFGHGERQAAEQQLLKSVEKHLEDR